MRRKKPYIIHNLSRGTSIIAYGVKDAQGYLRSKGCALDNNGFNDFVADMDMDFNGMVSEGSNGDEYEVDVLVTTGKGYGDEK